MNPNWKQPTPHDQFIVLLMSLEGHFENFKDNLIDKARFVQYAEKHLEQLDQLKPFLRAGEWPKPEPTYEKKTIDTGAFTGRQIADGIKAAGHWRFVERVGGGSKFIGRGINPIVTGDHEVTVDFVPKEQIPVGEWGK